MKRIIFPTTLILLLLTLCLPVGAEAIRNQVRGDQTLIYEETFDYENISDSVATLEKLGWTEQSKEQNAYSNPSAKYAIEDGKLKITNDGADSYALMLSEDVMSAYAGKILTIQYDMTYTTASDTGRYFAILTNYGGQTYNSFHFRNRGNGNNQAHFNGRWVTYDVADGYDAYSAADDKNGASSIAFKLLGKKCDGSALFANVAVTVRLVLDPQSGLRAYMKLADKDTDAFVLVSRPALDATNTKATFDATLSSNAICFKVGGKQNGYVDNIAVWTGEGGYPVMPEPEPEPEPEPTPDDPNTPDTPTDPEPTPEPTPAKVTEPHEIVNKLALGLVAIIGCAVVVKKEKK